MNQHSIYIPRMFAHHNEHTICEVMDIIGAGSINRIDFTPINKKPGFGEKVDDVVKSAFIHFNVINTSSILYQKTILYGQSYKIQVSEREYWICLKNKNPVQPTLMNIHQVVENGRHLESIIEQQEKKINDLEIKLENVHQVVYQLIGGLFNQEEQHNIIHNHLDVLFNKKRDDFREDVSKWGIYPTTRQGDHNEERIERLERKFEEIYTNDDELLKIKHNNQKYQEVDDSCDEDEEYNQQLEEYLENEYRWRHQK